MIHAEIFFRSSFERINISLEPSNAVENWAKATICKHYTAILADATWSRLIIRNVAKGQRKMATKVSSAQQRRKEIKSENLVFSPFITALRHRQTYFTFKYFLLLSLGFKASKVFAFEKQFSARSIVSEWKQRQALCFIALMRQSHKRKSDLMRNDSEQHYDDNEIINWLK